MPLIANLIRLHLVRVFVPSPAAVRTALAACGDITELTLDVESRETTESTRLPPLPVFARLHTMKITNTTALAQSYFLEDCYAPQISRLSIVNGAGKEFRRLEDMLDRGEAVHSLVKASISRRWQERQTATGYVAIEWNSSWLEILIKTDNHKERRVLGTRVRSEDDVANVLRVAGVDRDVAGIPIRIRIDGRHTLPWLARSQVAYMSRMEASITHILIEHVDGSNVDTAAALLDAITTGTKALAAIHSIRVTSTSALDPIEQKTHTTIWACLERIGRGKRRDFAMARREWDEDSIDWGVPPLYDDVRAPEIGITFGG